MLNAEATPALLAKKNVTISRHKIPYSNGRYREESHESSGLFGTGSCGLHSSPLQAGSSLLQQKCSYVKLKELIPTILGDMERLYQQTCSTSPENKRFG